MSYASPTILKSSSVADKMSAICGRLQDGHCIAIPTETVYGLAADATNGEAVARIFEMKARPGFNPLICHVDGAAMAKSHARFDETAEKLAETFWPGPLTLILPLKEDSEIHPLVTAGLDTVGMRCPKGISRDIIKVFGKPLAAPSANRSGRVSPTSALHVQEEFGDEDLWIIDDGPCPVGIESTIIKPIEGSLEILRPGSVTAEMLEAATGLAVRMHQVDGSITAPGMLASHYSPDTPIVLNVETCAEASALMAFGEGTGRDRSRAGAIANLSEAGDLKEAASNLYAAMKELDAAGLKQICVEPIPETGLGIAINDRLKRAAAPRDS